MPFIAGIGVEPDDAIGPDSRERSEKDQSNLTSTGCQSMQAFSKASS